MMINPVQPKPCTILGVTRESEHEWTFRVQSDAKPSHGQFMQLSIPKIGEAPISVSAQGDDWLEFTIRSVGKVTDSIFHKTAGDTLFLRGPYGKGWLWRNLPGSTRCHYRRHRHRPCPFPAAHVRADARLRSGHPSDQRL